MSFGLPALKIRPEPVDNLGISEGFLGVADPLSNGLSATKSKLGYTHPLEASEKNWAMNQQKMNLTMLRNTQGLHAPLKLTMELNAMNKVGRLPFLQSSHALRDSLLGRDLEIGFEDILNLPEFQETAGQPHAVVERSLGLL